MLVCSPGWNLRQGESLTYFERTNVRSGLKSTKTRLSGHVSIELLREETISVKQTFSRAQINLWAKGGSRWRCQHCWTGQELRTFSHPWSRCGRILFSLHSTWMYFCCSTRVGNLRNRGYVGVQLALLRVRDIVQGVPKGAHFFRTWRIVKLLVWYNNGAYNNTKMVDGENLLLTSYNCRPLRQTELVALTNKKWRHLRTVTQSLKATPRGQGQTEVRSIQLNSAWSKLNMAMKID